MKPEEGFIGDLGQSFPNSAPTVQTVLRIYRDLNKFNLYGLAPSMCSELEDIPQEIIGKALSLYMKKADKDHKAPHPNYFLTICHRLDEELGDRKPPTDEPPLIIGKTI